MTRYISFELAKELAESVVKGLYHTPEELVKMLDWDFKDKGRAFRVKYFDKPYLLRYSKKEASFYVEAY
jgi:hypothetical protein